MSQEKSILLVGGPDSGKTNYLGRLWLTINDGKGELQVDGTPSDLEYLNDIVGYFYKGQFAPHTAHEVRNNVVIPIKSSSRVVPVTRCNLIVPDVSGEEWLKVYRRRDWPSEWEESISTLAGCLIFVRIDSDTNIPAVDWVAWSHLLSEVGEGPQKDFDVPTQIILVDWLQCLQSVFTDKEGSSHPRISVIVTAYDLLPEEQKSLGPNQYLRENFPLFWQFIISNSDQLDLRVFGTSIASGDFDRDKDFRNQFLINPNDAGFVIYETKDGVISSKDMSLPVLWAMGI